MGLDMYLSKAKRVNSVTAKELNVLDNYFDYVTRKNQYRDCTLKEWCNLDMEDVNMDLTADYITEYVHRYSHWDTEKKYGFKTIFQQVGYWRKANHIHNWFVQNVQNGVDDCGIYEVKKYQLEELLRICNEVLNASKLIDGQVYNGRTFENGEWKNNYIEGSTIEDSSVAKELLPTTDGFFFGGTDYDEYYYLDVKNTVDIIKDVLKTTNFRHEIVIYHSSW